MDSETNEDAKAFAGTYQMNCHPTNHLLGYLNANQTVHRLLSLKTMVVVLNVPVGVLGSITD